MSDTSDDESRAEYHRGYRRRSKRPRNVVIDEKSSSSSEQVSEDEQDSPENLQLMEGEDFDEVVQHLPHPAEGGNDAHPQNEEHQHQDNVQVDNVQHCNDVVQQGNGEHVQVENDGHNILEVRNAVESDGDNRIDSSVRSGGLDQNADSENSSDEADSDGPGDGDGDNDRLYPNSALTVGDAMLAILTFFMRHKLTGQCLNDLLSLIALLLPPNNRCAKTIYKFKKYFSMIGQSLVVFHYFCSNCEVPLDTKNDVCEHCGDETKADYFLELALIEQIQTMFLREGFYEALQFRFTRGKANVNNIEDIYDGEIYKDQMESGFLNNPDNLSFMWYSDGLSIFKSNSFSIWPIFLVINELNYVAGNLT